MKNLGIDFDHNFEKLKVGNINTYVYTSRDNSFSANIPIVAGGNNITSIIPSGYVSGAVFILVDANMHQVDLLNPMYITLTLEPLSGYE